MLEDPEGFRTELVPAAAIDVSTTLVETTKLLDDIDLVIIALSHEDLALDLEQKKQSLLHQAGLIRAVLRKNGVIFLIEDSAFPLFDDAVGIPQISFDRHSMGQVSKTIFDFTNELYGPLYDRRFVLKPIAQQLREWDIRMAMLLASPILLLTLLSVLRILSSDLGDRRAIDLVDLQSERSREGVSAPSASTVNLEDDVRLAGGNMSLPISCSVSLEKGQNFLQGMSCGEDASLVVEKIPGVATDPIVGPWHNNVRFVDLDPGVILTVNYEGGGSDKFIGDPKKTTVTRVNIPKAEFGIDSIDVVFNAVNQRIALFRTENEYALLRFTLDKA
jgi:hypothetical protein